MELTISQAARILQLPRPNIYYAMQTGHFNPKASKGIGPKELVQNVQNGHFGVDTGVSGIVLYIE